MDGNNIDNLNKEETLLKYFREHLKNKDKAITMQNIQDMSEILEIAEYDVYIDEGSGKLVLADNQLGEYDDETTPEDVLIKANNLVMEWENDRTIIQEEDVFISRFKNFYESDGTYSLDLNNLYQARIESEESDYPKISGKENAKRIRLANGYIEKTVDGDSEYYDLYSDRLVCMNGESVTFKGYTEDGNLRFVNEMGESDTEFTLTEDEFNAALEEKVHMLFKETLTKQGNTRNQNESNKQKIQSLTAQQQTNFADVGDSHKLDSTDNIPENFTGVNEATEDGIVKERENKEPGLPTILSFEDRGVRCEPVTITAEARKGIPAIDIIGLPDSKVEENREVVKVASEKSSRKLPAYRLMLSAEPMELKKTGEHALALALAATAYKGEIPPNTFVAGKLLPDGSIEQIRNLTGALEEMKNMDVKTYILPRENLDEIESFKFPDGAKIKIAGNLKDALEKEFVPAKEIMKEKDMDDVEYVKGVAFPKLDDEILDEKIIVNKDALRATMIAVAGRHNLLLYGKPGCGKTLLASRLDAMLPALDENEKHEVEKVRGAAGLGPYDSHIRPFRMPHQTASLEGMVGGGHICHPGELSLANKGVLLLDEAQEFKSHVLQAIKLPLEHKSVILSRAGESYKYPTDTQVIMTANPCACGNFGENSRICLCSKASEEKYWEKMKGMTELAEIKAHVYSREDGQAKEKFVTVSPREIREKIAGAIAVQRERGMTNHELDGNSFYKYITEKITEPLSENEEKDFISDTVKENVKRTKKQMYLVARTIADLDGREIIDRDDLMEAGLFVDFNPERIPKRNLMLESFAETLPKKKVFEKLSTITPDMTDPQKKIHKMFDDLFNKSDETINEYTKNVVVEAGRGDLRLYPEFMKDENKDKWWKLSVDHAVNSGGSLWQSSPEREELFKEYGITSKVRQYDDPDKEYGRLMRVYLKDVGALSDELYHKTVLTEKEKMEQVRKINENSKDENHHFSMKEFTEPKEKNIVAKNDGFGRNL